MTNLAQLSNCSQPPVPPNKTIKALTLNVESLGSCRDLPIHEFQCNRPVVLSYQAARQLTGLTFPADQGQFLYHICHLRKIAIVSETSVTVVTKGEPNIYHWKTPRTEQQTESKSMLRRVAQNWPKQRSTAKRWARLLARLEMPKRDTTTNN